MKLISVCHDYHTHLITASQALDWFQLHWDMDHHRHWLRRFLLLCGGA